MDRLRLDVESYISSISIFTWQSTLVLPCAGSQTMAYVGIVLVHPGDERERMRYRLKSRLSCVNSPTKFGRSTYIQKTTATVDLYKRRRRRLIYGDDTTPVLLSMCSKLYENNNQRSSPLTVSSVRQYEKANPRHKPTE